MVVGQEVSSAVEIEKAIIRSIFDQPVSTANYLCHWSRKYKYVYVETPKVACTTVKRVLQLAESDGSMNWKSPGDVHDRSLSPLLSPRSDIAEFKNAMEGDQYFRFCFVRNPFARSLSCWLDKIVQNEWERKRLAPALGLNPETPSSFIDFLTAVSEQSDEDCDLHWAPQTYLLRPHRIKYSFVGRFELFREQFRSVCNHLNIAQYVDDLPDTWHATKASEKVRQYVGKKELELIHKIYERDFRNFGYGWSPDLI